LRTGGRQTRDLPSEERAREDRRLRAAQRKRETKVEVSKIESSCGEGHGAALNFADEASVRKVVGVVREPRDGANDAVIATRVPMIR
jgi:hypothetical protein